MNDNQIIKYHHNLKQLRSKKKKLEETKKKLYKQIKKLNFIIGEAERITHLYKGIPLTVYSWNNKDFNIHRYGVPHEWVRIYQNVNNPKWYGVRLYYYYSSCCPSWDKILGVQFSRELALRIAYNYCVAPTDLQRSIESVYDFDEKDIKFLWLTDKSGKLVKI